MDPYDLELDDSDNLPEPENVSGRSAGQSDGVGHPPPVSSGSGVVEDGFWCGRCGYALDGLPIHGQCPECGLPVRRSLGGDLLRDAGFVYVESLRSGATLILVSLIASFAIQLLGVLFGIGIAIFAMTSAAAGGGGTGTPSPMGWLTGFQLLIGLFGIAFSIVGLVGWWKLSMPDPRHGPTQQGTARQVVRVAVLVATATSLLSVVMQPFFGGVGTTMLGTGLMIATIGIGIMSVVAGATMFFAAMFYIKGLAVRVPDLTLEARAKTFVWLLPVIYILGSCVVIGPMIALVMYAWLINRVRIDMIAVLKDQALRGIIEEEQPGMPLA